MRFKLLLFILCVHFGLFATGCGPRLSRQDLGTVLEEVPQVPGSDEPFRVPGLEEEPSETQGTLESADK